MNSVTDTLASLLGTSSWWPGAPPIMDRGSLFTSTLLPVTMSLVTSWFRRMLACCPPAETAQGQNRYDDSKYYIPQIPSLPMEYLAFLGDEMIMYCCSAGRVTPRLVPGCFGEATAVKWEWLEYQNTEL